MLKMTCLEQIYRGMKEERLTQCVVPYSRQLVKFSVIFDIKNTPYVLRFGVIKGSLSFAFNVERGFIIENIQLDPEKYRLLVKVLDLKYDPNNKFSPRTFLETFNTTTASTDFKLRKPTYQERAYVFTDVEEADKVYFLKWLSHGDSGRHVTNKNLEKTLKWLGEDAYFFCKNNNVSTCWTANESEAQDPDATHPSKKTRS